MICLLICPPTFVTLFTWIGVPVREVLAVIIVCTRFLVGSYVAMGSEDQFVSFILHSVFLYPLIGYLLAPHPTRRWLGVILACITMAAFAYFTLFYGQEQPNYYEILGVHRDVSMSALKKAFKRISLVYHPDKNRSAAEAYEVYKSAYDVNNKTSIAYNPVQVLSNVELRRAYDIGGAAAVEAVSQASIDSKYFLLQIFMHLCFSGFSTFLISSGDSSGIALKAGLVILIGIFALEIAVSVLQLPVFPIWLLPSWTPFDIVHTLRRLYPTFLSAARCYAGAFYISPELLWQQSVARLVEKQANHNDMRNAMVSKLQHRLHHKLEKEDDAAAPVGLAEEAIRMVRNESATNEWDISQVAPPAFVKRNRFNWHLFTWVLPITLYVVGRIIVDKYFYKT